MLYGIHLIAGAAIGKSITQIWLASILAFLSHFILDALPHADYPLNSFKSKKPGTLKFWRDAIWVVADLGLAILIIWFLTKEYPHQPAIWLPAFFAWLPDLLVTLAGIFPNCKILQKHLYLHHKIVHNWHFTKHWFGFLFQLLVLASLLFWLMV